jgi:hypothetical protein
VKIKRNNSSYSFEAVIWFSVVFNNKFLAIIDYKKNCGVPRNMTKKTAFKEL